MRTPQRGDEILRLVGGHRLLESVGVHEVAPALEVLAGFEHQAIQEVFAHACEILTHRSSTPAARPESIASAARPRPSFQSRSTPRRPSTSAILVASLASATPRAWYFAPAGLHSGPRMLKTLRMASSRRGAPAKRNDGWKIGANRKPMPTSSMHRATPSGCRSILTPSFSSTSAEPQSDEAARLPCLATRAPQAAATIADRVEMLNVASPSPPVPQVSSRAPSTAMGVATARAARAKPVSSSGVSPF